MLGYRKLGCGGVGLEYKKTGGGVRIQETEVTVGWSHNTENWGGNGVELENRKLVWG